MKRQDWDHKAYHDAPSAMYCAVEGDMHIIQHLVHYDMPCNLSLVSSALYNPYIPFLN